MVLTRVVFLGPPGAGKGTLAQQIKDTLGVPHISTGDLIRAEIKAATPLGKQIKETVESGALVKDELIIELMRARLQQSDAKQGYILDGYPRTVKQAEALSTLLTELGLPLQAVVSFEVGDEVVVARLSGRRQCRQCGKVYHVKNHPPKQEGVCDACGGALYQREDDKAETVRNRLSVYGQNTRPLVDYYQEKGIIRAVDASGTISENLARLRTVLEVP